MVVAQLVEWLLPFPEVHGSNPVIWKNLYRKLNFSCFEKTKIKNGRPGMAHLKNFLSCRLCLFFCFVFALFDRDYFLIILTERSFSCSCGDQTSGVEWLEWTSSLEQCLRPVWPNVGKSSPISSKIAQRVWTIF